MKDEHIIAKLDDSPLGAMNVSAASAAVVAAIVENRTPTDFQSRPSDQNSTDVWRSRRAATRTCQLLLLILSIITFRCCRPSRRAC